MQHTSRMWVAVIGVSVALLTAGCKGGGGLSGLFGIFGGSDSSSPGGEVLASLFDSGVGGGDGVGGGNGAGDGLGGGDLTPPAATHNPEPASVALFGTGLVGAAFLRRRRNKARRS